MDDRTTSDWRNWLLCLDCQRWVWIGDPHEEHEIPDCIPIDQPVLVGVVTPEGDVAIRVLDKVA